MLIIPQPKRQRRKFVQFGAPPAPPAPLTLVAAYYDGDVPAVFLTFDREVDTSAAIPGAFVFDDGPEGIHFVGVGAQNDGPTFVRITVANEGSTSEPEPELTVDAANGIVAVDDGGTWGGCADLVLPFG